MRDTKEPFFSFAQQDQMCQTASFSFDPSKQKNLNIETRLKGDLQIKQIFGGQPRQSSRDKQKLEKFKSECNLKSIHSPQLSPEARVLPLQHQRSVASLQGSSAKRRPQQANNFYVSNRKQPTHKFSSSLARCIRKKQAFNNTEFSTTLCNSRSISNMSQNDLFDKLITNKQIHENINHSQHQEQQRDSSLKRLLKLPARNRPSIQPLSKAAADGEILPDILMNKENSQFLRTIFQQKKTLAPLKEKIDTELSCQVNTLRAKGDTAFLKQKQQMAILTKLFSKNSSTMK